MNPSKSNYYRDLGMLFSQQNKREDARFQLETALERGDDVFNMSGGEQLRDYLPVEKVAEYIVKISMQDKISGIINCCSGELISIRKLVENYLAEKNKSIELNLGYYPYPEYEPIAFWGNNKKLRKLLVKTES